MRRAPIIIRLVLILVSMLSPSHERTRRRTDTRQPLDMMLVIDIHAVCSPRSDYPGMRSLGQ